MEEKAKEPALPEWVKLLMKDKHEIEKKRVHDVSKNA